MKFENPSPTLSPEQQYDRLPLSHKHTLVCTSTNNIPYDADIKAAALRCKIQNLRHRNISANTLLSLEYKLNKIIRDVRKT